jgi:hypothetical protein
MQVVQGQVTAQAESTGQSLPIHLMMREYKYAFAALSPHEGMLDSWCC